ncbi:MAG TPA: hypothetical protein PK431_16960, partial [Chitinophagales bacterium]|nr:hypothetical protein [Chitinophagales bacterium]
MSNITDNKLSIVLTQTQIDAVKAAIATIQTNLPMLLGLTLDERKTIPKVDVNNKIFVEDAITAMDNNPSFLPAYFNVAELKKDLTLYQQLDPLLVEINKLAEKIDDTQMLAGSEAYVTALAAYRNFEAAAKAGIQGADTVYELLKARFSGQG